MREKRYYTLIGDKDKIKEIIKEIDTQIAELGLRSVEVYLDSYEYEFLVKETHRKGIILNLDRFEMEYSKFELENSQYFHLQLRSYCSNFPEEYGTKYSYDNRCQCCGSGKKQISELFIDKSKMGKKDISLTYSLDVVVSEKLRELIIQNRFTGVEFGSVRHINNRIKNEPNLYQLLVTNTLAPMDNKSVFYKEKFCERCQRSGLFLNSLPHYDEEALNAAMDFNYTYEYFGSGIAGTPYIIVSKMVYMLFRDSKIKDVVFDIVKII